MKVYYLQQLINNKHPIVLVLYDYQLFSYDLSTLSPYEVKTIDEIDPENKGLCLELARYAVAGKYYIGTDGNLYQTENWQPLLEEIYM